MGLSLRGFWMSSDFMSWGNCERNFVRKVEVDVSRARSMLEVADGRVDFLKGVVVGEKNVSFLVEGYYEVMKELLTALFFAKGLKCRNHQCLFSYFYKMFPDSERDARFVLRMNMLRNRLNYYGEVVDLGWYEANGKEILRVVGILKGKVLGLV